MKFQIEKNAFVNGLTQVLNIVGTRAALPVLSNVLIKAQDDALELTTTNLDIGIRCTVTATVQTPGTLTLPARKLAAIIKALPEGMVEVDSSNEQAKITCGRSRFRIMGMDDKAFPALPKCGQQPTFTIHQQKLRSLLRHVSYAQSIEQNRYFLNGVYFTFPQEAEGPALQLVATDSRRLSLMQCPIEASAANELADKSFILPYQTVTELERLLQHPSSIKVSYQDKQVMFELVLEESARENGLGNSILLVSKIIEGKFPNYQQVIPKSSDHHVQLERALLLECIQRAALVSSLESNTIKLQFNEDTLEISASSADLGEAHESMTIDYKDAPLAISFNSKFLMDPLKAIQDDRVVFEFSDTLSPGVIKTNDNFLGVIMPLRL